MTSQFANFPLQKLLSEAVNYRRDQTVMAGLNALLDRLCQAITSAETQSVHRMIFQKWQGLIESLRRGERCAEYPYGARSLGTGQRDNQDRRTGSEQHARSQSNSKNRGKWDLQRCNSFDRRPDFTRSGESRRGGTLHGKRTNNYVNKGSERGHQSGRSESLPRAHDWH